MFTEPQRTTVSGSNPHPQERIASIDALRGLDMFFLIGGLAIVRAALGRLKAPWTAAVIEQLKHSEWRGFHFIDAIFPLFLFLVGASMALSFQKRLDRGDSRARIYGHIVKRAALLLLLGLICNGLLDFHLANFHYTGVLQRIAVSYFFAAMVVAHTRAKGQAVAAAGLLLLYWGLMTLVPVPEHGAGVLTPEGSLAAYIDQQFLPGKFYRDMPFDEDGILSQIPSTASVLLGVLAGRLLKSSLPRRKQVAVLLAAGAAAMMLALLWDRLFPIVFRLWTSSYALLTAGISSAALGIFYWIIDVKGCRRWAFPLAVIGMNPLTIYVAQNLFDFGIVANIFVHGFIHSCGALEPVLWAVCVFLVKWLFLYFLYRQKIFLRA
jgi:predicted acyltransferase